MDTCCFIYARVVAGQFTTTMGKCKKWTPLLILGKLGGWSLSDGHMDDCAYIVLWKVTYAHYVMLRLSLPHDGN